MSDSEIIVRDRSILGGCPVFRGTRVQVEAVFDNLADGCSLDEIMEKFPTLDRADVRAATLLGERLVARSASRPGSTEPETSLRLIADSPARER